MDNPCVSLKVNRELIDCNFDGYKLSLDPVPTYTKQLDFPSEHLPLSEKQYALQHVKAFATQNLLHGDPWHEDTVYLIDTRWKIMKFSVQVESALENAIPVLQLPNSQDRSNSLERVNCSLHFPSQNKAVLCNGAGQLLILDTFNRAEPLMWKLEKEVQISEDAADPLYARLLHSTLYETQGSRAQLGCVLVDVHNGAEDRGEGGGQENDHKSVFTTRLHWLTLAPDEKGEWEVSSRRVFMGSEAPNYAVLDANNEAILIASEKPFRLVSDSEKPVPKPGAKTEAEVLAEDAEDTGKDEYVWAQNDEEISVQFPMSEGTNKSDIHFKLTHKTVQLQLGEGKRVLLSGTLVGDVDVDSSTWTLADSILEVILCKKDKAPWQTVVEGDTRGKMVLDGEQVSALNDLARLVDDKPAFNLNQLEECDRFPNEASLMVRFHGEQQRVTHQVNLGSNQWLLNCQSETDALPAVCLRHDVDGVVWQPTEVSETTSDETPWKHAATFNAFGFVQASKQQRKFTTCSPDFSYAVICDCVRHIYIYRQPSAISSPLRNRKTGRQVSAVAKQQVVSLESVEDIAGIHATKERIFVLAGDIMHVIRMN